jgi:hypothetical protein
LRHFIELTDSNNRIDTHPYHQKEDDKIADHHSREYGQSHLLKLHPSGKINGAMGGDKNPLRPKDF